MDALQPIQPWGFFCCVFIYPEYFNVVSTKSSFCCSSGIFQGMAGYIKIPHNEQVWCPLNCGKAPNLLGKPGHLPSCSSKTFPNVLFRAASNIWGFCGSVAWEELKAINWGFGIPSGTPGVSQSLCFPGLALPRLPNAPAGASPGLGAFSWELLLAIISLP